MLQTAVTISAAPSISAGESVKAAQATRSRKNRNFGGRSANCTGVSAGTNGFGTSRVTVSRTALASTNAMISQDGTGC